MLAGTQVVDPEIRAGAEVVADPVSADCDPVVLSRLRVGEGKIGKNRVLTQVFQEKLLFHAILFAQLPLPFLQFPPFWTVGAGKFGHGQTSWF